MKLRITVLIPAVLLLSTLVGSLLMFQETVRIAGATIRQEARQHLQLDISRLQNILYNSLTGDNLNDARLGLSITAMDGSFSRLLVIDETNRVLLANRYLWEGALAQDVAGYQVATGQQVRLSSQPFVTFDENNEGLLIGYYPVILQLQSEQGLPIKRTGVLYAELSVTGELAVARSRAINQSLLFGGGMLIVAALIALLLHWLVSRRLARLTAAAKALADGDLDTHVGSNGSDELAELSSAFNDMAAQIKQDIQHRQAAEDELRQLNDTLEERVHERTEWLKEAQRIGRMGNWNLDGRSNEVHWSDEMYRILGYEPGSFAPTPEHFLDVVHPEDAALVRTAQEEVMRECVSRNFDFRVNQCDGTTHWVHAEAIPRQDESGRVCGLSGTVQDITQRKQIEQSLVAAKEEAEIANRAKSDFLSRMSHELRTPMNAILGFTQVLELDDLNEDQRLNLNEIKLAGTHLLELIKGLLDLSRIEAGRFTTVIESVDCDNVINDAINMVRPLADDKQLVMQNRCASGFRVLADSAHLTQVLVNLLSNAIKYNRDHGVVMVECEKRDDSLRFRVQDTGPGIAPEQMRNLFKAFERMDAEYGDVHGAGIGLALSKQLVELMGGTIGVDSNLGQGAVFWVDLPSSDGASSSVNQLSSQEDANVPSDKYQVLYIEDNPANLRLVEAIFARHPNMTLISATNGEYGLELARRYRPDVILLDINLPGMDGYAVLETLRDDKTIRDIPVVALSADAMPLDVERGRRAGFRDYLTKPVQVGELIRAITFEP